MKGMVLFLLLVLPSSAFCAVKWTGSKTVISVQVVEHGGFLLGFDSEIEAACTEAGTTRLYIYPNQNGVTSAGLNALLSVSLVALSSGMKVDVMYENSNPKCFGQYLTIKK